MSIPPGQNPFFLSPAQTAAQPSFHQQPNNPAAQRTALPPRNSGNVSALRAPTLQDPSPAAQAMAPGPSNNQPQMPRQHPLHRRHSNVQHGRNHNVNGGPWGNPIGDPGGRLPWRNMKANDPLPKGPSFSECVRRMSPQHRYPFPPPQPPRPGPPRQDKKLTPLQQAEAKSRAKWLPQSQPDQGWKMPGQTGQSRGQWQTQGTNGQVPGSNRRPRSRAGQWVDDDPTYVEDLRLEGSWGWKGGKKKKKKKRSGWSCF
jgi:hypothetical protein